MPRAWRHAAKIGQKMAKDGISDEYFMKKALEEAKAAYDMGEVPVGAVVVFGGKVIARAHNMTEALNDPTAHAEMQAITMSADVLGGKYLKGCTIYVTVEPCAMCAAALSWSQIGRVVYGASDPKRGAGMFSPSLYHPKTEVCGGVMENECSVLMTSFFSGRR